MVFISFFLPFQSSGAAIDTGTYGGLLAVNGYTAEYGGRTVSLNLAAVDVWQ